MASIDNVKLGACSVTFADTDLGHTQGGVTISYEPNLHEVAVDKYGSTPVDEVVVGETFTATVPLAESTIDNFLIGIPGAEEANASKATIGRDAGYSYVDNSATGELVLHPLENDAADLTDDVVMYNAVVTEAIEIAYENEAERIIEVTFKALIDTDKSDGDYLGFIGDSTA